MIKYDLWMSDIVFFDNKIFFSAGQFNGLFKVDVKGGKAEFIATFPKESRLKARLHSVAIIYKDEIIFFPDLSNYITLYNVRNNTFVNIRYPIKSQNDAMKYCPKIVSGILIDSCVYAFSAKDPCIIRYNFETKELKVYDEWSEEFKAYGYRENISYFCRDICLQGNSILAKTYQNNVIVEFDLVTEKMFFHQINERTSIVLCSDADNIYFLKKNGISIYRWDGHNLFKCAEQSSIVMDINVRYQCSACLKDELWFFPFVHDSILVINSKNGKVKNLDVSNIRTKKEKENVFLGAVWFRKIYDKKLFFMPVLENRICCFANSTEKVSSIEIYTDRLEVNRYLFQERNFGSLQKVIIERDSLWGETLIMDDFLDLLVLSNIKKVNGKKNEIKVGKEIHKICSTF